MSKLNITLIDGDIQSNIITEGTEASQLFKIYQTWQNTGTQKFVVNDAFEQALLSAILFNATHRIYNGVPFERHLPIKADNIKNSLDIYRSLMILFEDMQNGDIEFEDAYKNQTDNYVDSDALSLLYRLLEMHYDIDGHPMQNDPKLTIELQ